jgi:hypothetical protein
MVIMGVTSKKSSRTGVVKIKKCGFNTRPKLMVSDPAGDDEATMDVLPELFKGFEGKKVRVTIEPMK